MDSEEHLNPVGKTKKQEETIPKVLEKLVPRYATRTGGYTRLLLNGHRSVGSDRAPLAVIELVDNPKDTIYHLAKNTMPNIQQQLEKVHQEHYNQSQVTLFHPVTGEPQSAVKLEPKLSLRKDKVARLNKKERGIMKVKVKYEKALNSFPLARALEGLTIAEPMAEVPTSTASALPLTSSTETKDMTENKDQPPPPPTPSEPGTEDKKGWGFGDVFKKLGFK